MSKLSIVFKVFSNKYFLSFFVFIIWVTFFDRNDLITQWERKQELQKLEVSTAFYEDEILKTKKDLTDLNNNSLTIEKFAREKFYLKRQNEDIFLVDDSVYKKN